MSLSLFAIIAVFIWSLSVYFCFRAISSSRTPQGSVAWVIFLLSAPFFAVPVYLFLGNSRFSGYIVARRDVVDVASRLKSFGLQHQHKGDNHGVGYAAFEAIAQAPVVGGNNLELLHNGNTVYPEIFAAFESAQNYILAQSYIINDDEIGREFKQKLTAAAKRGVVVHLLFDSVGCNKLPERYLYQLRQAGVIVMDAHALRGPKTRFQLNFRNHRKTIIVDGEVGFTGGLNIGDEYLGKNPKFGAWRDTHAKLFGPVVTQLQLVFCEDWFWANDEKIGENFNWAPTVAPESMDAIILAMGPADEMETGSLYFCAAIDAAKSRVWIASPYFVPEIDILTSLKLAAMKGVDVRIMVPEVIDHRTPWYAAFAYFDEIIAAGVKVYRYNAGFMHHKSLLIDDTIASIGTMNLDNRSCRLNFETTALFFDKRAARMLSDMFENDFKRSFVLQTRLSDQPWRIRYGAPIARLFAPLL